MPVFNGEEWLRPCLDSVLAQGFSDFELITVDDASTDETASVLASYAQHDERIQVLTHERNSHAGISRNDGMAQATGEYLLFLDADDLFEPTLLERAFSEACATDADVVLLGADEFEGDEASRLRVNPLYLRESLLPAKKPFCRDDVSDYLFQICTPEPWSKLFHRSFVEERGLRFQGMQNANDLYFTLYALAEASRISACPERLIHHRVGHAGSIQARKGSEPMAFLTALRSLHAMLENEGLFPQLEKSFANLALFHCIFNRGASVCWAEAFAELGVSRLRCQDVDMPGDFERLVEMAMTSSDERLDELGYDLEFWREAARCESKRAYEAQVELELVRQSASFRLGSWLTTLPRSIRHAVSGK